MAPFQSWKLSQTFGSNLKIPIQSEVCSHSNVIDQSQKTASMFDQSFLQLNSFENYSFINAFFLNWRYFHDFKFQIQNQFKFDFKTIEKVQKYKMGVINSYGLGKFQISYIHTPLSPLSLVTCCTCITLRICFVNIAKENGRT